MTKIDIISGFLGAGKTTLIKKLIKESFNGQQIVLIENEFGEIGIDGGFLKEAKINITEMNSGCICCSLVGDFGTALKEVLEKYHPDRIIIEPSGVGKLSDVVKAVQSVMEHEEVEISSQIAVVDAVKAKIYMKNFGEFFNNQIEHATTIILSRTQNLKQEKIDTCVEMIRSHNGQAVLITTPWEEIDGMKILEAMEKRSSLAEDLMDEAKHHNEHHHEHGEICSCGNHGEHHHEHGEGCSCGNHEEHHHEHGEGCTCGNHGEHHHHHADDVFTSWGMETAHKFEKRQLEDILEQLADGTDFGTVLRAKGILPNVEGDWFHFDLTPGEFEIRDGSADYTGRLCVIGTDLKEDSLKLLFGL
ncbi:MAG: GTP-binding protein [Lachnospiraceae bacterium]|nr:GTP-binding protein [Lachnospiraceae bacterium]